MIERIILFFKSVLLQNVLLLPKGESAVGSFQYDI